MSVKYLNIKFHTCVEIPTFHAIRGTDVAEVIGRDFATLVRESALKKNTVSFPCIDRTITETILHLQLSTQVTTCK